MAVITYVDGDKKAHVPDGSISGREEFHIERGAIHVFTNEDAKAKWLSSSGYGVYYRRGLAVLAQIRREMPSLKQSEESLAHVIKAEESAGRKAVERLLAKHKVAPENSTQFAKLMGKYVPENDGSALSIYLYDGPAYTGSWRWLRHGLQIAKLSWIGFDDMTSSLRVFGGHAVLCQHTWWGGNRAWFGGSSYCEQDLAGRWWDNRASSVFSF